jgi:hypothetical protein
MNAPDPDVSHVFRLLAVFCLRPILQWLFESRTVCDLFNLALAVVGFTWCWQAGAALSLWFLWRSAWPIYKGIKQERADEREFKMLGMFHTYYDVYPERRFYWHVPHAE